MKHTGALIALLAGLWTGAHGQGTLLISELLYQPRSGEAEYVELYNNSGSSVELADYHVVRWLHDTLGRHYPLPRHTVAPHDYVVLTTDAASVAANYEVKAMAKMVECQLPPYPNTGGSVVLCDQEGTVVDRFDYSPSMHSRLLRNKTGVSLERRRFDLPTNEAGNWFSASSISGYGTPGYGNSQSMEVLAEETGFRFSPPLISPDGDGMDDELAIEYSLPADEPLSARAEVYDLRGLLVRRLLNGDLLGTNGTIVWDGKDHHGNTLPEGQYVLLLILYNQQGTQQTVKRSIGYLPSAR